GRRLLQARPRTARPGFDPQRPAGRTPRGRPRPPLPRLRPGPERRPAGGGGGRAAARPPARGVGERTGADAGHALGPAPAPGRVEPAGRLRRRRADPRPPLRGGVPAGVPAPGPPPRGRLAAARRPRGLDRGAPPVLDEAVPAAVAGTALAGHVP